MTVDRKKNRLADTVRRSPGITTPPKSVAGVLSEHTTKNLDRRTTIYLSSDTWKQLKVRAALEETSISQIVEDLVSDYIRR